MTILAPHHLVPLLIVGEADQDVPSGSLRVHSVDGVGKEAQRLVNLGLLSCKLYVRTPNHLKNERATAGLEEDSLMVRAISSIKDAAPTMRVGTEVCACAYHSAGECVLLSGSGIDDAATHDLVSRMAVLHADAGADVVVAGLTHGDSIRAIRAALDDAGHGNVDVMGSLQLRSGFYAPYRKLMGTEPEAGETFRSHLPPEQVDVVLAKAKELIEEGATSLSIQPALVGMSIVPQLRRSVDVPLAAYSVSTELNLVRGDGPDLWLASGREAILAEYFSALINAGADQVQTYVAGDLASWLIGQTRDAATV